MASPIGFPILNPIASVAICIFIEKASIDIFKDAMDKMADKSCPEETIEEMEVDVEILVDSQLKLIETHEISEESKSTRRQ